MNEVIQKKIYKKNYIYNFIKRAFDILIGTIGTILLIPIALFIKLIYIIKKDYSSIFYTQNRIGKDGKLFRLYKFRSMVHNADQELEKLLKENKNIKDEYKKYKKIKNDPRITKIGRILRKTSLDETPQFINILKGDMTLIGNRPYLIKEKKEMGKYYNDIIKTKPGLTGYWQVIKRSDTSFEERLKLEKFYSNNYTLKLDIIIFFKTILVVLRLKGESHEN